MNTLFTRYIAPALAVGCLLAAPAGAAWASAETNRPDRGPVTAAAVAPVLLDPAAGPYQPSNAPQDPQSQPDPAVPSVEHVRKLSRTFRLRPHQALDLNTRYGRVQVNVWSRNEVRADVDIITRADTDDKAQQLQEMIQVQMLDGDPALNGALSVKSRFGAMPGGCWSRQRLYEVNYTLWVPSQQVLRIANMFGDVNITGDLTGPADLAMEYGTLHAGRLEGVGSQVRIKNGSATLDYLQQATVEASYARLRLNQGRVVELRNNYSDIDIGTVQDLTVHSKYGDVALGTVRNLRGSSGYGRFSVDKVSERLDMTVQHCTSFEVRNTSPNFRQINLDGGYSTILLNFPDGTGFNFDVNTQFGKLLLDKRLVRVRSEETSPSVSDLQGQYGRVGAAAAGSVSIRARYTNVSFNR